LVAWPHWSTPRTTRHRTHPAAYAARLDLRLAGQRENHLSATPPMVHPRPPTLADAHAVASWLILTMSWVTFVLLMGSCRKSSTILSTLSRIQPKPLSTKRLHSC